MSQKSNKQSQSSRRSGKQEQPKDDEKNQVSGIRHIKFFLKKMEIKEKEPANEKTLSERSGGSEFHSVYKQFLAQVASGFGDYTQVRAKNEVGDICDGDAESQNLKRQLWDLVFTGKTVLELPREEGKAKAAET
jgi:hypothetical protein